METILLEDNQEYILLDKIKINNIPYVYMVLSTNNPNKTVCIRKLDAKEEKIIGLDSVSEYNMALQTYIDKYKDLLVTA